MSDRIVCAAVRIGGVVFLGARHFDAHMSRSVADAKGRLFRSSSIAEQGFINQRGEFLTRTEAYTVAEEAGQIIRRCGGDEGVLFSENLY